MKTSLRTILALGFLTFSVSQIAMSPFAYAEEDAKPAKPEAPKEKSGESGEGGDSKAKPPADVSGGRFAGDPIYVHIAPMVMPVISDSGVEQLVTLILDVQVKDFDAADAMHSNMPKVMDSLMRYLYGGLGQGTLRNGKLVNIAKVKAKATLAVGEVIGADKVENVLIQSVSQRML